jgi:hypothetical protein
MLVLTSQFVVAGDEESASCRATTTESVLRHRATSIVEPPYPIAAKKEMVSGLAVASICVPVDSILPVVLEVVAPNDAIRQSVTTALSHWRFMPPNKVFAESGDVHSYGGKVIFYFARQNGEWKVLRSVDSFYVGPTFTRPPGE